MILQRKFFARNTLEVARDLLGCVLVRKSASWRSDKEIRALITETEAYMGADDLASHASRGRTPRTELMYGAAGHAYVYLIYGMYHCLNIVTEKGGFPAAVLIRAVAIDGVEYKKTNGPGKLCKVLGIDRKLNGHDVTSGEGLWLERGRKIGRADIVENKRIGVDYAGKSKDNLWRFTLKEYAGNKKEAAL